MAVRGARTQPAMPVIGFLTSLGRNDRPNLADAFRRGLRETGYVEGRDVAIEYRFAENQHDRLPAIAADLVGRKVAVIAATGGRNSILAAKASTTTIPIVFTSAATRPGGLRHQPQSAGRQHHGDQLVRCQAQRQGAGAAARTYSQCRCHRHDGNPKNPESAYSPRDAQEAARMLGRQLLVLNASTPSEIDTAFATLRQRRAGALLVGSDPFFTGRRQQIVALAARDAIPDMYTNREFVADGGLMSYGNDPVDAYRRAGVYVGRILKGDSADRPAGRSGDQVRVRDQPQDRQGARPRSSAHAARPRRRGDRMMKRREFIALLGGAAAWPVVARGQQAERVRLVGILQNLPENDPVALALVAMFLKELQQLGWTVGSNISVETRWAGTASDDIRRHAAELVALAPDIILANGTSTLGPLLQQSKTIPIVFVQVTDPVGSGYVSSLARPGGNATGFAAREYGVSGKWLEVLKQIAPAVRRAGVVRNPAVPSGSGQFGAIQAVSPYLGIDVTPIDVRSTAEIERMAAALATSPNSGLIITANGAAVAHRKTIIEQAALHKLPAVYWQRHFVEAGGLVSYGEDGTDQYRRAAGYVDRILQGSAPADLPVQAPTKYETVINLKTAKALGLEVPPTLLARADEVIE